MLKRFVVDILKCLLEYPMYSEGYNVNHETIQ